MFNNEEDCGECENCKANKESSESITKELYGCTIESVECCGDGSLVLYFTNAEPFTFGRVQ